MFNKILLACCSKKEVALGDFVARVKITVFRLPDIVAGFSSVSPGYGGMEFIEGEQCIVELADNSGYGFLTCLLALDVDGVVVVNETTGVMKSSMSKNEYSSGVWMFVCPIGLYDGIEDGQDCVISIYLKG